eukprot:CAMPEP_0172566366 /NCGR_PEP_ID=MMETSP1067-20121228/111623_1 /TAXON_ID=265564 ORGANISM="Thalassiosira punctigera, Strain Tpunct2005C2" /NCGR_SAMPLE_ID=MMETSP1067 /ASSEMBLY_ACC=CAM_ASM_000444 /LENGTH=38 /DNA_ID= /DNA_START= /DNA_END= /DNA_ORIENTATION=
MAGAFDRMAWSWDGSLKGSSRSLPVGGGLAPSLPDDGL